MFAREKPTAPGTQSGARSPQGSSGEATCPSHGPLCGVPHTDVSPLLSNRATKVRCPLSPACGRSGDEVSHSQGCMPPTHTQPQELSSHQCHWARAWTPARHMGGQWPSPVATFTTKTVTDNHTGDPASAPSHWPCCGQHCRASLGWDPDLQGGQVLGQLLFELDGRQGGGVRHEVSFSQGAALRGALAHFFLPFFTFPGISVKS